MNQDLIHNELTEGVERYSDVYFEFIPNKTALISEKDQTYVFTADNQISLEIKVLTPTIFRVRYAAKGIFERDFSYAVEDYSKWEKVKCKLKDKKRHFLISTEKLNCKVDKKDMKVSFQDALTGKIINEEAAPFYGRSTILKGMQELKITKIAQSNEAFFGLGDKSGKLNLRGQKLENWNTDAFGFDKERDPLYRSIPFYYGLNDKLGYGIFLDNYSKSHFDFDTARKGKVTFSVESGALKYFFIYGPELIEVAKKYVQLTGLPELPPLWALGFHQCRWSYYPEERVRELASEFRAREIPCDAIYLDIDYMDGYRCFTWNDEYFPKPAKMIKALKSKGFHTVVMIDPGLRVDPAYEVYQSGLKKDVFCRRTDGELMTGPVWPPDCVFPDFTNSKTRKWWGELYHKLYKKQGVSGFWNDMNEPAVFKVNHMTFPDEVMHNYEGEPCNHKKVHNVYGQQMSRATFDGLKKLLPEKRPFLLTRATFSGGQRYAAVWTGDNFATWEHLRLGNIQCQRLSISGFSFTGTDIGGFADQPDGELFVRWLQLGIFHPLFRVHSMGNKDDGASIVDEEKIKEQEKNNRLDQEPWVFGDPFTDHARKAIELRYQLLPYIYTTFWQYITSGNPMLKSLVFEDQADRKTISRENEFVFGDHLLVAPVIRSGAKSLGVYFPKGDWYDYWTGKAYTGQKSYRVNLKPDRLPIFVRAGAVIPLYPVQQYTNEKKIKEVRLSLFHGNDVQSQLYLDAGEGYGYQKKQYNLRNFYVSSEQGSLQVKQKENGKFKSSFKRYNFEVIGLPFTPSNVNADGKNIAFTLEDKRLEFKVSEKFKILEIR